MGFGLGRREVESVVQEFLKVRNRKIPSRMVCLEKDGGTVSWSVTHTYQKENLITSRWSEHRWAGKRSWTNGSMNASDQLSKNSILRERLREFSMLTSLAFLLAGPPRLSWQREATDATCSIRACMQNCLLHIFLALRQSLSLLVVSHHSVFIVNCSYYILLGRAWASTLMVEKHPPRTMYLSIYLCMYRMSFRKCPALAL